MLNDCLDGSIAITEPVDLILKRDVPMIKANDRFAEGREQPMCNDVSPTSSARDNHIALKALENSLK